MTTLKYLTDRISIYMNDLNTYVVFIVLENVNSSESFSSFLLP